MNPTNRLETILDDIVNGRETTLEPVNRLETYLKLISQNGTGGGVSSWNNLKDKPFYDESVVYFEYVDGYTPLDSVEIETGIYAYKVSNTPLAKNELVGLTMEVNAGGEIVSGVLDENGLIEPLTGLIAHNEGGFYSVFSEVDVTGGGLVLGIGLWVLYTEGQYVSKLYKESIKALDIKYLPDELYTEIDNRINAVIEEALGGEY